MALQDWDFDIFISYAHLDNRSLFQGQPGWITQFHNMLEIRLGQVLGKMPRIWRDERLQGNDLFNDEIAEQVQKAATIICVLSPRYILSEYCTKELQYFINAAERSGNLRIGNRSRVFKVVKTDIELNKQPLEIKDMLGYPFYKKENPETPPIEYLDLEDPPIRKAYFEVLNELVFHVKQLIETLESYDSADAVLEPDPSKKVVYLAETTSDLKSERDRIKREIERDGHRVLPDLNLGVTNPKQEIETEIENYLAQCDISIHMLGAHYGIVPEDASESLNEIQLQVAVKKAQEKNLSPIIWIPKDLDDNALQEKQQIYLRKLRSDEGVLAQAELLETNLTELKSIMDRKLSSTEEDNPPMNGAVPNQIYLIYDQEDTENVKTLDDYLFDQGFDVIRPIFEGDQMEIRKAHQYFMTICEGVLVYQGRANDFWFKQKLQYFRKINGYGRETPLLAKGVYFAPPNTQDKERFRTNLDIEIIRENEGFDSKLLQPFIHKIRRGS